jgi:hypothetical protein
MLVLQTCRVQALWDPSSFHRDFKGRPVRPGCVLQGWSPRQGNARSYESGAESAVQ